MSGANYEYCPVCDQKALYVGEDVLDGVVVLHQVCLDKEAALALAERAKLAALRASVRQVLDDEESGEGGWGPDVTMVTVLQEAMEASAP